MRKEKAREILFAEGSIPNSQVPYNEVWSWLARMYLESGEPEKARDAALRSYQMSDSLGQSEERMDALQANMAAHDLSEENYWWYTDLRKFGSVAHAGFGLGFERLIMLVTGVSNIRDVIPYPRTPGSADF